MAALGIAAIGSALGTGTAGMAAIGVWKKHMLKGKALFYITRFCRCSYFSNHLRNAIDEFDSRFS